MANTNEILAALAGGKMQISPEELLDSLGSNQELSTRERVVLQLLMSQREQGDETSKDELDELFDESAHPAHERSEEARRLGVTQRIKKVIVGLAEELAEFRRIQEMVAAALGACPECMGQNRYCETCRGTGNPGTRDPNPQLYRSFISPAVERFESNFGSRSRSPDPSPVADEDGDVTGSVKGGTHG